MTTLEFTEDLLNDFIDWARHHSDDAFYVFDNQEEAVDAFLKHRGL